MSILEGTLVLFIEAVYPEGHKFMMDNDPKHVGLCCGVDEQECGELVENCRVPRSQPY